MIYESIHIESELYKCKTCDQSLLLPDNLGVDKMTQYSRHS